MRALQNLRIGYVPCDASLTAPGDRRRFCYYAAKRKLRFEVAHPSETYDVVVLTQSADISLWARRSRERTKLVFDFIDSYLAIPRSNVKSWFRGLAKFAAGQNRWLLPDYRKGLERMCRRADAVICTSREQERRILPFCSNVHRILDFHGGVAIAAKHDYAVDDVFHFVWEGLPWSLRHLREIKSALEELQKTRRFAIHAITDLAYGRYLDGRLVKRSTLDDARKIWPGMHLYAWNERTFSAIATRCDLALVPVPLCDPLAAAKPENRLLLFWRMGIPALVSTTSAHQDAMRNSGIDMACANPQEWIAALKYYMSDAHARENAGRRGRAFVHDAHPEERSLRLWDDALQSVLDYTAPEQASEDSEQDQVQDLVQDNDHDDAVASGILPVSVAQMNSLPALPPLSD